MPELNLKAEQIVDSVENFEFEPIKGYAMLNWQGKRPFRSTQYYPAQLKETYGEETNGWINKIFWGDNLQVMSHLLKKYRGQVDLIYIDPPFDSKADYKKKIKLRGQKISNERSAFEEKQYTDIWNNDEYLQYMYERLILLRELLSEKGAIYLHCDFHKVHLLRCIMDEIFGASHHLNSLVWEYQTRSSIKTSWKRTHDDILFYKKNQMPTFNWNDDMVLEPLSEATIKKYKFEDENGKYRLNGRNIKDSPIKSAKDVDPIYEKTHPEWVVRDYLRDGKSASDYFFIDIENQASPLRTDYPTQKPEELLYKLISASSCPGDLIFDCFMGSGTTQAVAMKLGRRFIGADINLGAIETTTKRLLNIQKGYINQQSSLSFNEEEKPVLYTGFEVYNVNNYDIFRNPVEAKDLLKQALELQPLPQNELYDGEKDGRLVKIMPVNRIATRSDLNELLNNFPLKTFDKRMEENPGRPVERITLVCMGHEPNLGAELVRQMKEMGYIIDVEVLDILRDKTNLEFKRDAVANITIENKKLVIREFYPMNLLQKLSIEKESIEDWRELADSVKIDFNFDGSVFNPGIVDIPEKDELIKGIYPIPDNAGSICVKITDLLSESLEITLTE